MEGVEILTSEVVQVSSNSRTMAGIIVGIIVGCIALTALIIGLYYVFQGEYVAFLLLVVSVFAGAVALILVEEGTDPASKKSYVKQQVVVDDSVGFNEFMEHYEIKDHDGKIWEVIVNDEDD